MVGQLKTIVKEWGNSLGLVIPKDVALKQEIKPNDEVFITITKKNTLEDFFGKIKGKKIDAQKAKDESRRIWKMD